MKRCAAAIVLAFVLAGCASARVQPSSPPAHPAAPVRHAPTHAIRYGSVGVTLTPASAGYRPSVSRREVLGLFARSGLKRAAWSGRRTVQLHTVDGKYPAWVIAFHHAYCTAVAIYDLHGDLWTWTFQNCVRPGKQAECEGPCTPLNQDALDRAANYAQTIAGRAHVFAGVAVDDDANKVIVHLAHASQSVLDKIRAGHPGLYVIDNDAPRTLRDIMRIDRSLDWKALKKQGIDIVMSGPTQNGNLTIGVTNSIPKAQAYFDAKYGRGVIRVVHAEPGTATASVMQAGTA